jgi:hypothetical protein
MNTSNIFLLFGFWRLEKWTAISLKEHLFQGICMQTMAEQQFCLWVTVKLIQDVEQICRINPHPIFGLEASLICPSSSGERTGSQSVWPCLAIILDLWVTADHCQQCSGCVNMYPPNTTRCIPRSHHEPVKYKQAMPNGVAFQFMLFLMPGTIYIKLE